MAGKIAGYLRITTIEVACARLERRIERGLKGELLPLVENIKGVGRIRGRLIFKAGCKTIEDIQQVNPEMLSAVCGLPEQICERIINSAKEYTPLEEQESD